MTWCLKFPLLLAGCWLLLAAASTASAGKAGLPHHQDDELLYRYFTEIELQTWLYNGVAGFAGREPWTIDVQLEGIYPVRLVGGEEAYLLTGRFDDHIGVSGYRAEMRPIVLARPRLAEAKPLIGSWLVEEIAVADRDGDGVDEIDVHLTAIHQGCLSGEKRVFVLDGWQVIDMVYFPYESNVGHYGADHYKFYERCVEFLYFDADNDGVDEILVGIEERDSQQESRQLQIYALRNGRYVEISDQGGLPSTRWLPLIPFTKHCLD